MSVPSSTDKLTNRKLWVCLACIMGQVAASMYERLVEIWCILQYYLPREKKLGIVVLELNVDPNEHE
jgi:hypothetical protein